jgi:hypothetical protein
MQIRLLLYILILGCALPIKAQPNKSSGVFVNADSVSLMKSANAELWYVDSSFIEKEQFKIKKPRASQGFNVDFSFINILMWLVIAAAIGLLIYFLINNFGGFEGRKRIKENISVADDTEEIGVEQLYAYDYQSKINAALEKSDFALATRWYYLWVIRVLDEKEHIRFEKFKSAGDYKDEVGYTTGRLAEGFRQCCYYYEFLWFGGFEVTPVQFDSIREKFNSFLKSIS